MQMKLRPLIKTHQLWGNTELLDRSKNMNIQQKTASPQNHAAFLIRKKSNIPFEHIGISYQAVFFLQIFHYVLLKKKNKK